jgi:hypothetical protein
VPIGISGEARPGRIFGARRPAGSGGEPIGAGVIRVRRAYEPAAPNEGSRFLVDRLGPRGVSRRECPPLLGGAAYPASSVSATSQRAAASSLMVK